MAYLTAKEARNALLPEGALPSESMDLMKRILDWGYNQKVITNRMINGVKGHPTGKMVFTKKEFNNLKKEL